MYTVIENPKALPNFYGNWELIERTLSEQAFWPDYFASSQIYLEKEKNKKNDNGRN